MIDLDGDNLPEDPSELSIPSQISVAAYRKKVEALFEGKKSVYTVEESGDQHSKFAQHLNSLLEVVVEEEAKNTKAKRVAKKQILSKEKVYDLLDEHRLSVFTQNVIKFLQSVEEKVDCDIFFFTMCDRTNAQSNSFVCK